MRVTYMTSVNHTLAPNATVLLHAYNFAPNPRKPAQTLAFAHKTSRKFGLRMLVVGRGTPSWSCIFLIWTAGKPLKRPESDEEIQENPNPFSWSGLAWIWFGLEEIGLRRSARRRRLLAPNAPSGWAKPVALDGNQTT